ncbi:MAG: peptidylprolyl isomerase, partial [archaeon]|nr:peptidylprolyl isomerase [archaeon]
AALAIAIIAGFAGWYSYSTAHSITTTQNTSTDSVSSAGLAFVRITTHYGIMEIELFQNDTPKTVANFLQLVSSGFYDGLVWHRIVRDTNPTKNQL